MNQDDSERKHYSQCMSMQPGDHLPARTNNAGSSCIIDTADSDNAPLWLSRVRNWQANTGAIPAEEGRRAARQADERALALNPNLAAAHIQMGRIKQQVDLDWVGADASFQRAFELEPDNPNTVRSAGFSAEMLGRFDQALQLDRRALELDPLNAESWVFL